MPDNKPSSITPPKGGFFKDLSLRVKLILRLIGDSRVSPLLKLIPIATAVYLFVPDLAPGPIDDAAIIWLGTSLFVELCPPEVVAEHMEALRLSSSAESQGGPPEEEILEGKFRDE